MELKDFQDGVLTTFSHYLEALRAKRENAEKVRKLLCENPDLDIPIPDFTADAWKQLKAENRLPRARKNIPFSPRISGAGEAVPSVCLKIPTGGGKTLLAGHAVARLLGQYTRSNTGFVLWIVPNESIYAQTIKALRNREHPYRQLLDRAAAGRVKILEKTDPLDRRDVDEHLCIMLLMLQSANRQTKETLKLFRDRGNVRGFFPPDDVQAHARLLDATPNLDVYGRREMIGAIVKDSLGNALRVIRPIVILDEGHKGYSTLAMKTLYGFNPSFVLELTATPVDRPKDKPPTYSNWLVNVRGADLYDEQMIKLPINVTVKGGDDWRDCLRESYEHLSRLQKEAEALKADTSVFIRPICLVQVERTGKDQRDGQYIHADDAREYLLTLGAHKEEIAIKTSDKNELNTPENQDLMSPLNQVRFIITKQALQEGWDCPFAYVLCSLAPVSAKGAMTQLVGRILRQPYVTRTERKPLDECYVFCYHSSTRDVVNAIKNGLESDGMGDLAGHIRDGGSGETPDGPRKIERRQAFRKLRVFLPLVLWTGDAQPRPLDYEADILYRIDWDDIHIDDELVESIPQSAASEVTQVLQVGLKADQPDNESTDRESGKDALLDKREVARRRVEQAFDPVYVTRAIVDLVPNPWQAHRVVEELLGKLYERGFDKATLGHVASLMIEKLRQYLTDKRDALAEALFLHDVKQGTIQFRLRADRKNWKLPNTLYTQRPPKSPLLQCGDGDVAQNNLFEPVYREDYNSLEQNVACYLDGHAALKWWHRNVATAQAGYALQGWRKNRVYPDFIFALAGDKSANRLFVLETKGNHLDNPDSAYKKKLLDVCTEVFELESAGELELVTEDETSVTCSLVFEETAIADLEKLVS